MYRCNYILLSWQRSGEPLGSQWNHQLFSSPYHWKIWLVV